MIEEEEVSVCSIAQRRHRDSAMWRNRWTFLLWVCGVVIVLSFAGALLFYLHEGRIPGLLSAAGAGIEGAATGWVVIRRAEAVREEEEAFDRAERVCG